MRSVAAMLVAGVLGLAGAGCSRGEPTTARESASLTSVRLGLLFTRIGLAAPQAASVMRFDLQGHFARHAASDADRVATILGVADDDTLAVDSCRDVDSAEELDRAIGPAAIGGPAAIKLLDAGRLVVKGPADAVAVSPRHYPELTPYVGGVVYGSDEWLRLAFEPGASYEVTGEGGDEVAPFSAQVAAPRSFVNLEVPIYHRGDDLDLRWTEPPPGEATEPLVVVVAWSSRTGRHEVRCRVRDDGSFTVRRELLAAMPQATRLQSAEVSAIRLRHGAGESITNAVLNSVGGQPGSSRAVLTMGLRSVWALPVSTWSPPGGAALPDPASDANR